MNIEQVIEKLSAQLLDEFRRLGHWEGRLSSSALSTAVASFALRLCGLQEPVQRALEWVVAHQNNDGGWGDTPESPSNMSTTLLVVASLHKQSAFQPAADKGKSWLFANTQADSMEGLRAAVLDFYHSDKTFSVPILMLCTAAELFGAPDAKAWRKVPQLPFEFSVLPSQLFPLLNLRVVSYALPALIGIGLVRHTKGAQIYLPQYHLRKLITKKALRKLESIQPQSGGFLEAAPLSGFVLISLIQAGYSDHSVAKSCKQFLLDTQRYDGSWPIDTDLSNWVTSLAITSLGVDAFTQQEKAQLRALLLDQQTRQRHPYTGVEPGGWAWTQRSGGVPDGDDTAAALKALWELNCKDQSVIASAANGIEWLLGLQNSDGGIPTFCKGWGRLPFDASCADITAHALHAWSLWYDQMDAPTQKRLDVAAQKALSYLRSTQRGDGSWTPLWFGNQKTLKHENPVFGTAQVVRSLAQLRSVWRVQTITQNGVQYLLQSQSPEGGWGGAAGVSPTIEETALALSALKASGVTATVKKAEEFLISRIEKTSTVASAPIGLYFASLWYDELLYPVIYAHEALRSTTLHNQ